MKGRQKIAIVAGDLPQPRFLQLFEPLANNYEVQVHLMNGALLRRFRPASLKLCLYEPVEDMPGYLKGLEDQLAGVDAILAVETSKLASFQAVRAARKYRVPFAAVVNEFHPFFYERFANIRAIQYDISSKADLFVATSQLAANCLKMDQVSEAAIRVVAPAVDVRTFAPAPERRSKFRNYVGLADEDFVLLFHHPLEPAYRPAEWLDAVSLVVKQGFVAKGRLKILFAGSGANAADLKYKAYDAGLGKTALFLHQDAEPFLQDLYAASDFYLMSRPVRMEHHEPFPLGLLEAMASGAVPILGVGSVAAELAGDVGGRYRDDVYQDMGAALQPFLLDPGLLITAKKRARDRVVSMNGAATVRPSLLAAVEALLQAPPKGGRARHDLAPMLAGIAADLARNLPHQALMQIEEALLLDIDSPTHKSEIYRLKGDAHLALAAHDAATEAYAESLRYDDRNHLTLRGLGFVSWQGHSNEEALVYFRKALALKEDDPHTIFGIGLVFRRLGLTEDALFWLEKCVVRDDCPPAAFTALAQTCSQCSHPAQAIKVIERVLDAIGEQRTLLMTLGQLYLSQGKTEEGHAILQKVFGVAGEAI